MLSTGRVLRLSEDWERLSCEVLRGEMERSFGFIESDSATAKEDSLRLTFEVPFGWLILVSILGFVFAVCLGTAFGLEIGPDLRILGVPGEAFFVSLFDAAI